MALSAVKDSSTTLRWTPVNVSDSNAPLENTLLPYPQENRGFFENQPCRIENPFGRDWSFWVDDEPLSVAPDDSPSWIWKPLFFAGEVTAELRSPTDQVEGTYLLDVSPDPLKTGREILQNMMDEIWHEDPNLILGSEPATIAMGALGHDHNPLVEFARLRRYGPQFIIALRRAARNPLRTLKVRRDVVPMHSARRVDRQTALAALRNPSAAGAFSGTNPSRLEPASETSIDVPVVEPSLDSPANRCLLALARALQLRIRGVSTGLARLAEAESPSSTRTDLAPRWPVRRKVLMQLQGNLTSVLRRSPFKDVARHEVTAAGLNAISADPTYARAYGLGWRAIRHGTSGPREIDRLWVSPTWEVYERWCFVRLGRILRESHPKLDWTRTTTHPTKADAAWIGRRNATNVQLLLQPKLPSGRMRSRHPLWSISRMRIPDIVLIEERDGERRFVVLDAKYRRSRGPVLDAMTSAHVYHDSLRNQDRPPDLSVLLVPAGGEAPWLEDPMFLRAHRVGVVEFGANTTSLSEDILHG